MRFLAFIIIVAFNIQCKDSAESNRRSAKSSPEKAPVAEEGDVNKSKDDPKDVADKGDGRTETGKLEEAPGDPSMGDPSASDPGSSDPSTSDPGSSDPTDPGNTPKADCEGGATLTCSGNLATICFIEGGSKSIQKFNVSSCPIPNLRLSCDGNQLVIKHGANGYSGEQRTSVKNCSSVKSKLESQM
jgi:hypothetical protein